MNFRIIENGKEIECEIITIFRDDNNGINYIVYTDGTKDANNELEIFASRYIEEGNNYILQAIETDSEWNFIDNMLEAKFRGNE